MAAERWDGNETHYLYRHFNAAGELLYIGVTGNVRLRNNCHNHTSPWWREVSSTTVEELPTRNDALRAEEIAIGVERPIHNQPRAIAIKLTRDALERIEALVGPNQMAAFIREAIERELKRREKAKDK